MRKAKLVFCKSFLEYPTHKDTASVDVEFEIPKRFDGDQIHLIAARIFNVESKTTMPAADFNALIIDYKDIDRIMGKLLTYVEATYSDGEQRKAHKDIVRGLVRDWVQEVSTRGIQTVDSHSCNCRSDEKESCNNCPTSKLTPKQ